MKYSAEKVVEEVAPWLIIFIFKVKHAKILKKRNKSCHDLQKFKNRRETK